MQSKEYFGVVPIKGIKIAQGEANPEIFENRWSLVSTQDTGILNSMLEDHAGFKGNLEMLIERLHPSCYLLFRRHISDLNFLTWREIVHDAELVVAALNLVLLTQVRSDHYGSDRDRVSRELPSPIWIPTAREHCELPIVFSRANLAMVGHSSYAPNWQALEMISGEPITNTLIRSIIERSDDFIRNIFNRKGPAFLRNASRALVRSLNSPSIGNFNAQNLACLDILFGESGTVRWDSLKDYVNSICTDANPDDTTRLFEARHEFVHRGLEPVDMSLHFKSLALVVATISGYMELISRYSDRAVVRHLLDANSKLAAARLQANVTGFSVSIDDHLGTAPPAQWVRDWLDAEVFKVPFTRSSSK
ncbi:MAG: hypothetical protein MRY75_13165 [Marivita sp.]|uniref:hypothetical protein n=1 Tax=Marivita sp. TaxID=2003365 RepID=UPI0025C299FF|nr:hypothetical protein [Marivita sp.]MCI5111496.1 hypothetical protein [Marivita sp.]